MSQTLQPLTTFRSSSYPQVEEMVTRAGLDYGEEVHRSRIEGELVSGEIFGHDQSRPSVFNVTMFPC